MVAFRVQKIGGKILIQLLNDSFQHRQSLVAFHLFRCQFVCFHSFCRSLLDLPQQFTAFDSPCNILYSFQHFRIQIIIVDIMIVPAVFGITVVVCTSNQRHQTCFQRPHHQRHLVSALGTKGQIPEHIVKIVFFRPVPHGDQTLHPLIAIPADAWFMPVCYDDVLFLRPPDTFLGLIVDNLVLVIHHIPGINLIMENSSHRLIAPAEKRTFSFLIP